MANAGNLRIVFISSEGSILPIVQKLTSISRCSKIFEIIDVSNEAAVDYLTKNELSRELSNKLIDYLGQICLFNQHFNLHRMYKKVYLKLKDEMLFQNKKYIFKKVSISMMANG